MFEGFETGRATANGVGIHYRKGGAGPPLLLLHGYPQTHVMWHRIAPGLARRFTVVASDLRGYGDSEKPPAGPENAGYSKRALARDQVELMAGLGFESFFVAGHDRGSRVAHRMALDHPDRVEKVVMLDTVPVDTAFENVDADMATAWFHWFFMRRPAPFPETMIAGNVEAYMRHLMGSWSVVEDAFTGEAWAEYLRCFGKPETVRATCAEYRAVTLDLEHHAADRDRKVRCPLLVLWGGSRDTHPGWSTNVVEPLAAWRERCAGAVRGGPLDCGHFLPEEKPEETLRELLSFLGEG